MLYFEDYLELIEHLPDEMRDRLTDIRELDLQIHNDIDYLKTDVKQFFESIKDLEPQCRKHEFEELLTRYLQTLGYADEKVKLADEMGDIISRLVKHLDEELEKFKLELEADNAGITEALEARSMALDVEHTQKPMVSNRRHTTSVMAKNISARRRSNGVNLSAASKSGFSSNYQNESSSDDRQPESTLPPVAQRVPNGSTNYNQPSIHQFFNANQKQAQLTPLSTKGLPFKRRHSDSPPTSDLLQSRNQTLEKFGFQCHTTAPQNLNSNSPGNKSSGKFSATGKKACLTINHRPIMNQTNLVFGGQDSLNAKGNVSLSIKPSYLLSRSSHLMVDLNGTPASSADSTPMHSPNYEQQANLIKRNTNFKNALSSNNDYGNDSNHCSPRNTHSPVAGDQLYSDCDSMSRTSHDDTTGQPMFISITKSGRKTKGSKQMNFYEDESLVTSSKDWPVTNSTFEHRESIAGTDLSDGSTTFSPTSAPQSPDFGAPIYQRDDNKYCVCRQVSYGEMVACDNVQCEIEWFHYDCVGITQPPKGKWFCPDCTRRMTQCQAPKKRGRKSNFIKQQELQLGANLNNMRHEHISSSLDI